jgi:hypothetical protein
MVGYFNSESLQFDEKLSIQIFAVQFHKDIIEEAWNNIEHICDNWI